MHRRGLAQALPARALPPGFKEEPKEHGALDSVNRSLHCARRRNGLGLKPEIEWSKIDYLGIEIVIAQVRYPNVEAPPSHRRPRCLLIWLGVAIMPALPALMGADLEAGKSALERSDYVAAMREFRALADQGLAEAQLEVGFLYWSGQGVPKNKSE